MNLIQELENDAVVVWDDFQKGVHWLEDEAAHLGAWLKGVDPAIGAQFQTLITDGEVAASALAEYGGQALSGLIAGAIPDIETTLASLLANSLGTSPTAVLSSKGSAQVVADLGDIGTNLVKVALVKVLGGIASTANAASGAAQ